MWLGQTAAGEKLLVPVQHHATKFSEPRAWKFIDQWRKANPAGMSIHEPGDPVAFIVVDRVSIKRTSTQMDSYRDHANDKLALGEKAVK